MSFFKLESSDKEIFEVEPKVIECFGIIKIMFEDLGFDENDVIPLPNINSEILRLVLKWAEHHKDDKKIENLDDALTQQNIEDIEAWDRNFLQIDQSN